MAVAYSAFATQLVFNGNAEIVSEWNVKIVNVTAAYVSEECEAGEPEFTDTSVTFNAKLVNPGDYITYLITIKNAGTINAKLKQAEFTPEASGSPAILYTTSGPENELAAGGETCILVKVEYDETTTQMPTITTRTITGIVEYVPE